ncbi:MAG: S1C family serine protease [Eubacteriales bacterium]|nr:S1C family serine protease [Eubacteriales bacterium]
MNNEKDKELNKNNELKESKKSFIVEKVVGRDISRKHAAKHMLLALASGLLFGLAAAFTIIMVGKSVAYFSAKDEDELSTESKSVDESYSSEITENEESQNPQDIKPEIEPDTENTIPVYLDGKEYFIKKEELTSIVKEELESGNYALSDLNKTSEEHKKIIENAARYVVAVNALSTNQSWFEDTVEVSSTFSGIIISESEGEILILTTEEAIKNGTVFNVSFYDGTVKEAVVKQSSHHDKVAVIAVSTEGLGKDFIEAVEPVSFGNSDNIKPGDTVLAVGAPIGKVRSYEFGQVNYVGHNEITADGRKDVFYSQLQADTEKGTFILNLNGELVGVAKATDEDTRYYGEASAVRIIGINYLKYIITHLMEGTEVPYIGIKGKSISFDMKYKNIPQGMYVMECIEESPAYISGIKKGDIITELNGSLISDAESYDYAVKKLKNGESVKIKLKRNSSNGEYKDLEFVLTVGAR